MSCDEILVEHFAHENKELRQKLGFVCEIFDRYQVIKSKMPKCHFSDMAYQIYEEATTDLEVRALQIALTHCYEIAVTKKPDLLPPPIILPVKTPPPFFSDSTYSLGAIHDLNAMVRKELHSCESVSQALAIVLTFAKHSGEVNLAKILDKSSVVVLRDAKRALLCSDDEFILADTYCMLLWRKCQALNVSSHQLHRCYLNWCQQLAYPILRLEDALEAIALLHQPLFSYSLKKFSNHISRDLLIYASTGHFKSSQSGNRAAKGRTLRKFHFEEISTCVINDRALAMRSCDYDAEALRKFRHILSRYKLLDNKELRNSKAYRECKTDLETLQRECINHCSYTCLILVHYCTQLFLHGSAWKAKLAVHSIQNYLSTLHQFCLNAFSDEQLLLDAQHSNQGLEELTDLVSESLSGITDTNQQNTVLRFLQYLAAKIPLRFFDRQSVEFLSALCGKTRVHYLSPAHFESAISTIKDEQTQWFLRLCYFTGLRFTESAHIYIEDFSDQFLYITDRERRKTYLAIRRVSLMFLPPSIRASLKRWLDYRHQVLGTRSTQLFDEKRLNYYLPQAIEQLRQFSNISGFVVHSLRHCAANNLLFVLSMVAFDRIDWRQRYAFCQHELFSKKSLGDIREQFANIGRQLSKYSAILNILAAQLGHSSPAITAANYLHFLNLLSFELSELRERPCSRNEVNALLHSNYKYEIYPPDSAFDEDKIFKHACRGLKGEWFEINAPLCQTEQQEGVTFIHFMQALLDFLGSKRTSAISASFTASSVPNISKSLLSNWLTHPKKLRLIEQISATNWNAKARNAVKNAHQVFESNEIVDVRTFRQFLSFLKICGFIAIEAPVLTSGNVPKSWLDTAAKYHCTLSPLECQHKSVIVKPAEIKAHTSAITNLPELALTLNFYIKYMEANNA